MVFVLLGESSFRNKRRRSFKRSAPWRELPFPTRYADSVGRSLCIIYEMADIPASAASGLARILQLITQIAALFSVFGYVSLRSFCNAYGFPMPPSLGLEHYLREACAFLIATAYYLAGWIVLSLFLFIPVAMLIYWRGWNRVIERKIKTVPVRRLLPPIITTWMIVNITAFGAIVRDALDLGDTHSLVGHLSDTTLRRGAEYSHLALAFVAMGSWYCIYVCRRKNDLLKVSTWSGYVRIVITIVFVFAILTSIFVPVVYGISTISEPYKIVSLRPEGTTPMCGVQILQTSAGILLWRAEKSEGIVQFVPLSKIAAITYIGKTDMLGLARHAASNPTSVVPDCTVSP